MLTMTITERDKKLLRVLAIFLILLGFVTLILMPALDKFDSLDAQAAELLTQKTAMEDKIISLPLYELEQEDLKTSFAEASGNYYPMMQSQEIDRLLTGIALGYALEVTELNITMPTEPAVMTPYLYSGLQMQGEIEADIQAEGEADSSSLTAEEAAASETENAGADSGEPKSASCIFAANATMGVEGSKENIQAFIDSLNYNTKSMLVTKYQMDTAEESTDEGGGHHLNISIAVYMYNS